MSLAHKLAEISTLTGAMAPQDFEDTPAQPSELFSLWIQDAIDAGEREPHVFTLSSVDQNGAADARVLVLKDVTDDGWFFAANATSPKGRQLARNPNAALTWYWPATARQVRLRGGVRVCPARDGLDDFVSRPKQARASIMSGRQSEPLATWSEYEATLAANMEQIALAPEPETTSWTMYQVQAISAEFWQSDARRRFTRVLYTKSGEGWVKTLLWP